VSQSLLLHIILLLRFNSYDHELVSRFRKEVIRALDKDSDGVVTQEDIQRLLQNIGKTQFISRSELQSVLGLESKIPVEAIRNLM